VKLFKKAKSRFYWVDFTVRGQRYRGSTGETKAVRATKVASMKLAQALEHGDLFPTKPTVLAEFWERFQSWLDEARVEEKTRKYYRNGRRLLKVTPIFAKRLTAITAEDAEKLNFPGSAGNANCALRTLRRMLRKAEEWKLIARAPKIKLMKERGRDARLDADAEEKLVQASLRCKWRARTRELFGDIIRLNARHRYEKRTGTLPDAHRQSGLEQPYHFCAGQQNSRRARARANEPSRS